MSQRLQKKQKYFLSFVLILELFLTSATPALAGLFGGGIKIPSASSIAADLEKRYHIDLGSVQNQGELFNVAGNKQPTPEVSLFFTPSDPKPGEKLSAKAFPIYFSSKETNMYYTWYLRHAECDLTSNPNATERTICDRNNDNRITVEDWKIEAAQIIAQNGFDSTVANYSTDNDADGYKARYGGDNKVSTLDYCYINDPTSGKNYELADGSDTDFNCPQGTTAVCMVGEGEINPGELDLEAQGGTGSGSGSSTSDGITGSGSGSGSGTGGTATATGETFTVDDTNVCKVSGLPACTNGSPICNVGTARCVSNPTTTTSCGSALSSCSSSSLSQASPYCRHLFPDAPGHTSGDGSFGGDEEEFWTTNPNDPDTADNGNKDEANVVGLGQINFTWNYAPGDKVGVAVEGMAMIPTKHDDSSLMIMWAFPKKDCPIDLADGIGAYTTTIKGYGVSFPTADFDLNKCISRNLVDPTEGGQVTNLTVGVSSTPENPINDETGDKSGDTILAQATVSNSSQNIGSVLYDWRVEISNNAQFRNGSGLYASDITDELQDLGLLGNIKGNALDAISIKMDIPRTTSLGGRAMSAYLLNDTAYLRFTARVSENFTSGVVRKGKSDVIVKFNSTSKKIVAYKASPTLVGENMRVVLPSGSPICNDDPLDRSVCRVIKDEIIGLRVDPSGLSNFKWSINGSPLLCGKSNVSPNCEDGEQNHIVFFPVTGSIGDTYTVTLTANDVTTSKSVTLTRSFNVVAPKLSIEPTDPNTVSPKFLGQYRDITGQASGCPGGLCNEFSSTVFQISSGDTAAFKASFLPGFLGAAAESEWLVDGLTQAESAPGEISFTADKVAPSVYSIVLNARVIQSIDTRRALLDVWGISQLDSPEINFSSSNELEVLDETLAQGSFQGPKKYLAAIISYIPQSILFSLRIFLSGALIIFTAGILFSLFPERINSYNQKR